MSFLENGYANGERTDRGVYIRPPVRSSVLSILTTPMTPGRLAAQRRALARRRPWSSGVNIKDRLSDASWGVCNPFAVGENQIQKGGAS
jgi:hypothetical protein